MSRSRTRPLPVWGYVLLNVIVFIILFVAYGVIEYLTRQHVNFKNVGTAPVFVVIFLSFVGASIFDAIVDYSAAAEDIESKSDSEPRTGKGLSRDGVRKAGE